MKILIITPIFPPQIGGPATYVFELCERWKAQHEITVVTFGEDAKPIEGVRLIPLKLNYSRWGSVRRQWSVVTTVMKEGRAADLIYAQGPCVVGLMSCLAARRLKKPLVVKFVGDLVWETAFGAGRTRKFLDEFLKNPDAGFGARIKIKLQRWVFHRAQKIIVPSHFLKSIVTDRYRISPAKVEVVYNAIIPPPSKPVHKSPRPKLVTIGRIVEWKHMDGIIRALAKMKTKDAELHIVGSGPEEKKLKRLVEELGVENRVTFSGALPHDATLDLLRDADVFVLNSSYEGLPHTVIEAMLLKIPVVATRIPGTTEIAIEGETAYLTNVGDDENLAATLDEVLGNPEKSSRIAEEALKRIAIDFNGEENLNRLSKILNEARIF